MTDEDYRQFQEERCQRKHRLKSVQIAVNAVRSMALKEGRPFFYYKCSICSKWHITGKDPKEYDLRRFIHAMDQALGGGHVTREEYDAAIEAFKLQQQKGGDAK